MHQMKRYLPLVAIAALCAAFPLLAQEAKTFPAPSEIVAAAKSDEWVAIAPSDLMIMDLAPDSKGRPRRVVIQLIPEPFSQGWIGNIRKLAAAKFWDGTSINRVQDNYVVQWGDASEKKALPEGLAVVPESEYVFPEALTRSRSLDPIFVPPNNIIRWTSFHQGFPVAGVGTPDTARNWPTHCYGMVGVGRNLARHGQRCRTLHRHRPCAAPPRPQYRARWPRD
jgi:peptidylprolyl isomerase